MGQTVVMLSSITTRWRCYLQALDIRASTIALPSGGTGGRQADVVVHKFINRDVHTTRTEHREAKVTEHNQSFLKDFYGRPFVPRGRMQ